MSRPFFTLGLLMACILHALLLIPGPKSPGTEAPLPSPVRIRDLPVPNPPTSPTTRHPSPPPSDRTLVASSSETPRPTSSEGPPPDLVDHPHPGDFQGDSKGITRPILRIDWGTSTQARSIVVSGELRLVTLDVGGSISAEIIPSGADWRRIEGPAVNLSGYSNRVRIVDNTPAFARAASHRRPGEHLALVLPLSVEHVVRSEQARAASRAAVDPADIKMFLGRFNAEAGELNFTITGFTRRI